MHSIMRAGLLLALLVGLWATPGRPAAPTQAAPGAAADCPATGHLITAPTLYQDSRWVDSSLRAVAAAGPGDVWAVGSYTTYIDNSQQTRSAALIEHWTGTAWEQVPGPEAGLPQYAGAYLNALAAINPRDVWAVGGIPGDYGPRTPPPQPLVERWDGVAWQVMPAPPGVAAPLTVVAASGPADVWTASGTAAGGRAFHWNGRAWQETVIPQPPDAIVSWTGLVAPAPGVAGIVGRVYNPNLGRGTSGLLAHWDGRAWTVVTPADVPAYTQFTTVAANGPRDVWVAGQVEPPPGPIPTVAPPLTPEPAPGAGPVLLHWDGNGWSRVPVPDNYIIQAMIFPQPDNGWASGLADTDGRRFGLLHWDGTRWTPVDIAGRLDASPDNLPGLAAETPDDLWAVGYSHRYAPPQPSVQNAVHIFRDCAVPTAPTTDPRDPAVTYFPTTGHTLRGLFRDYWTARGGLAQFGYPITDEFREKNPTDGRTYTVQYFERNRFELHPENAGTPYVVLLGLLGRTVAAGRELDAAFRPLRSGPAGTRFFPPTGHSLAPAFRAYWEQHGGLPVYGYPISEPFQEYNPADQQTYLVQYFERNRLELHPELPAEYRVSLGLLGVDLLRSRGWLR